MKQSKWIRNMFLLGATAFMLIVASCNQANDGKDDGTTATKFKVNFSIEKAGLARANIVAKDGTKAITSGAEVEKDHTVTFEVTGLMQGYKVKSWEGGVTVLNPPADKTKATLKITATATVKVILEKDNTGSTTKAGKLTGIKVLDTNGTVTSETAPITATVTVPNAKNQINAVSDIVVNATDVDGANAGALEVEKIEATLTSGKVTITKDAHTTPIALSDTATTTVKVTTKATEKIQAMEITITVTREAASTAKAGKLTSITVLDANGTVTSETAPITATVTVPNAKNQINAVSDIVVNATDVDGANEGALEVEKIEATLTSGKVTITETEHATPIALSDTATTTVKVTTKATEKIQAMEITLTVTREAASTAKAQKLVTLTVFTESATLDMADGPNYAASISLTTKKDDIKVLTDIAGTCGDAPDGTENVGALDIESIEVTVGQEKKTLDATHTDPIPLVTEDNKKTTVTIKTKASTTKEAMTITLTITNK